MSEDASCVTVCLDSMLHSNLRNGLLENLKLSYMST
jgi:hypothetical protein